MCQIPVLNRAGYFNLETQADALVCDVPKAAQQEATPHTVQYHLVGLLFRWYAYKQVQLPTVFPHQHTNLFTSLQLIKIHVAQITSTEMIPGQ